MAMTTNEDLAMRVEFLEQQAIASKDLLHSLTDQLEAQSNLLIALQSELLRMKRADKKNELELERVQGQLWAKGAR